MDKCLCGCGQITNKYNKSNKNKSIIKGVTHYKFIKGHMHRGELHRKWNGGKMTSSTGYSMTHLPSHPRTNSQGYVYDEILIAEKVMGKYLPVKALVHHVNKIRNDNRNENLVICQDRSYHMLLHSRENALKVCGHANWKICWYCKKYDNPNNLIKTAKNTRAHRSCYREYSKIYAQKRRKFRSEDKVSDQDICILL